MIDRDLITLSQICFIQVQIRSTSLEELQVLTELKCRAADSVPQETETGGTRLVLSSADYNLIWGVLTRRDHSTDIIHKVLVRHIMNFSD